MGKHINKRAPKLRFTTLRSIGWHVVFRDPASGTPRKHRFRIIERDREAEARVLYYAWVHEHLGSNGSQPRGRPLASSGRRNTHISGTFEPSPGKGNIDPNVLSGSLLDIASGLLDSERGKVRTEYEPRRRGTIHIRVFMDRKKQIQDFLEFMNALHGTAAASRLQIADLSMEDIEAYSTFRAPDAINRMACRGTGTFLLG